MTFLSDFNFLVGMGLALVLLVALLVYLEKKYHGLGKLFKKA